MALLGIAILLISLAPMVLAVEPGEMLSDPALEARAREISKELRMPGLPEPVDRRFQR
ncbi:MAG: cytochrome c-type biogenesis protein CcmH [Desulfobacterales bacterium]|nr:cytochrome c-type biogenesis protein CcmH [Desulfobacterales bacterium]